MPNIKAFFYCHIILSTLLLHLRSKYEVAYEAAVSGKRSHLRQRVGKPSAHPFFTDEMYVAEAQDGRNHAHKRTAGNKSAGNQRTLLIAFTVDLRVLRA